MMNWMAEIFYSEAHFRQLLHTLQNQVMIRSRSLYYLKKLLKEISKSRVIIKKEKSIPYCDRLFREPSFKIKLTYTKKVIFRFIKNRINKINKKRERWNVAYQKSNWRNLVMWKSSVIPNPKGRFFADPFVVTKNGKIVSVEDYNYSKKRGCIVS